MKNIDDITMQRRLYDILKMNIKLAKQRNALNEVPTETFESFEQASKKIDGFNHNNYEVELSKLHTVTTKLEEEKIRLEKLVKLIGERIDERNELVNEYQDLTLRMLDGLPLVTDADNLDMYKKRLATIREYLENRNNIVAIEHELSELNSELDAAYEQKKIDEEKNYSLEDELLTSFRSILKSSDLYGDINTVIDVEFELDKIKTKVLESKKTLDTFEKAFENLKKAGISIETEIEYSNYVIDAKETYYQYKEREFLLKIYRCLIDKQNECVEFFSKRELLDRILDEREKLRIELGSSKEDILGNLHDVISEQSVQVNKEKQNVDKIRRLNEKIDFKNKKLADYNEENSKTDILVILQEFGIISTYTSEDVSETVLDSSKNDEFKEEEDTDKLSFRDLGFEEEDENGKINPNAIKSVTAVPEGINISFVINKASTVMRRVGKALGFEPPKAEVAKPKTEYNIPVSIPDFKEIVPTEPEQVVDETEKKDSPSFTVEPVLEVSPEVMGEPSTEESMFSVTPEPFIPIFPQANYNISKPLNKEGLKVEEILPDATEKASADVSADPIFSVAPEPFASTMPEIKNNDQVINVEEDIDFKSDLQPGLFWPEPSDGSSIEPDGFVKMEQPFPSVKTDDGFNPQALNSGDEFAMPEIPMGNMSLSSQNGTLGSPIRIKRGR